MSLRLQPKKKLSPAKWLVLCGVFILLCGCTVATYQYVTNRVNAAHIAQEIDKANHGLPSSMPNTTKPDDSAFVNYRVAPDAPRYIYINKIAVKAMIKPMGLTKTGAIEAPENVHDAGWFTQSAKPDQAGAMVIDGHVANWATKSVFHDLKQLSPEDTITIERGDGKKIDYKVVKMQSYKASDVDMQSALKPVNGAKSGLNLITCDGKVINTNEFEKRLIVYAEQL